MKYIPLVLVFAFFISCNREEDFIGKNEEEIKAYIKATNLVAEKSETGLYYVIDEAGTGAQPTATSNVTVAYKGYFTSGEVFDQSDSNGISFGLQQVIKGWTEGISYFKEGGSGILLIPSRLGYGDAGTRGIPGGSVLIFDIALISVN